MHRDARGVGTEAHLVEIAGASIGVSVVAQSIPEVRIGDHHAFAVPAIQDP